MDDAALHSRRGDHERDENPTEPIQTREPNTPARPCAPLTSSPEPVRASCGGQMCGADTVASEAGMLITGREAGDLGA
jgi:hypothetical protein